MSKHPHSLKRIKKHRKNKAFLLNLFSEKCIELTPENYSEICRQVDNQLLEHCKSNIRSYQMARIEFAKYIKRFNLSSNQYYPVPAAPVRYERSLPLQNIETLKHGKKVTQFAQNMIAYWTKRNDFSPTQSLGFCLISSILFNGIYNHAELQFFLKIILKTKKFRSFLNLNHMVTLEIPNRNFGNQRINDPDFSVSYTKTFVLHDIVKCWIYRLKHQKFDLFSDIEDAEHLINACIIECFPEEKVRCKDLLKYGFYYTQFLKNSGLDQMSICILKNEIYSSSPLEKQLEAYFVQFEQKHTNNIKVENTCENHQNHSRVNIASDIAETLVEIRQAIRAKNYKDQLIGLYSRELSPALERLLLWTILRSKLTETQLNCLNQIIQQQKRFERKLIRADFQPIKQSSLNTMFSQFAIDWLMATQDKDISSFSNADFEDMYGEMLLLKKETTRETLQKRLQEFHHKQTLFFNAPTVDLDSLIQVKICRTALISPHIFYHMLEQLENTQDISIQDKNIFKLIFILGFRVGLRINETLNIFVRDLFISEDAVILTIRNNRNKNQKSYSAYRKIPLHHLLKADELHAFKTYSQNRKRLLKEQGKSVAQPLFLKQSLEETHENEVNSLLKQLIQPVFGEHNFTYHSLRHSAFNHLYLILKNSTLADAFTDYSPHEQLRIRYALLRNRNTQQTWYALSHFAGHLTPETTCSSYLHLMHLAISYQLNQMHSPLPKEAYFNILKHDDAIKYPVQQRAIKQFLFDQLTKDRYRQHDHQYQPEQQKSPDSLMLGAHDSEMTFELLHHILAVEKEQDLMLPKAIPLQIAQKLRARAQHLKTSCVNQKKSSRLFTTDFLRKTPNALVTMLPTNQEEKKVIQHVQERYANVQSKYKKQLHTIYSIYLEKVQPNSAQLIFELNEKRQLKKLLSFIHSLFPKKYLHLELSQQSKIELKKTLQDLTLRAENFSLNEEEERIKFSFKYKDAKALGVFKLLMYLMIVSHL
ncbi:MULTISPECIES: tyrosine-type recombinase/integrase [Acinetobacter]|jgi:integrase|uniref:Site-specific integrase n=2 Tax=Acinetobacter TaxID=469 RepID=A0A427URT9_ACIJO|nr:MULTISPECIES: tyrosine-type recombinase/integrase [Acinetobacter]MCU4450529.1 tyrosine-type recombinase/integrase [Acinetobacter lwoffii]QQT92514.1 site-specific integrase [Acinetobacter johnsonii]RSE23047.1 site-specific integrase [Acinetobacter johnsonii]